MANFLLFLSHLLPLLFSACASSFGAAQSNNFFCSVVLLASLLHVFFRLLASSQTASTSAATATELLLLHRRHSRTQTSLLADPPNSCAKRVQAHNDRSAAHILGQTWADLADLLRLRFREIFACVVDDVDRLSS